MHTVDVSSIESVRAFVAQFLVGKSEYATRGPARKVTSICLARQQQSGRADQQRWHLGGGSRSQASLCAT